MESYGSSPKRNCFSYPPLAGTIASIDELFDALNLPRVILKKRKLIAVDSAVK